jgi:hypothetical protein
MTHMLPAGGYVMQSQNNMVLPLGSSIVFVADVEERGKERWGKADKNTIVNFS